VSSQRGRLAFGALLAVLLLALVFRGTDWGALGQALRQARPVPLLGLILVTVVVYALRAWRWGLLLAPLGRVRFPDLLSATFVGFASGLLIPRAQEIMRPWLVSRRYPIPLSAGFATVILERLVDLITVLVLFGLYLFVLPAPAMQMAGPGMDAIKAAGAATAVVAGIVLGLLLALHARPEPVIGLLERLLARAPRWVAGPFGRAMRAFTEGLAVLKAPGAHLARIAAASLVLWLAMALAFHLNNSAFSLELPFSTTFLLLAFLVVGVAIPTPGMVGGFHAFYVLALHEVYGVGREAATGAAITAHALANLPILVLGLALLGREKLTLGRVAEVTGEGSSAPYQEVQP
jgi:uncharacterized protein (TIRG00374 family)